MAVAYGQIKHCGSKKYQLIALFNFQEADYWSFSATLNYLVQKV